MRISQIINNNLSQMYYQITQHYCGYVSKNQQKKLITWANKLIQMNFSFDLFKMLGRGSNSTIGQSTATKYSCKAFLLRLLA